MTLFTFKKEEEIKGIWFFKDDNGELKKKNYIFITEQNTIRVKGLPIIKSNVSRLSQKVMGILWPLIIEKEDIKFEEEFIRGLVYQILRDDLTLVANYYKVKSVESYKNKSSIQAQIASTYGSGEFYLVPNTKLGKVGKKILYCSIDEAVELSIDDLDLKQIWETELSPFIKNWESDKFKKRMARSFAKYKKEEDDKLQEFLRSDLFDSTSVGEDIKDSEFLENEIWFEVNQ